MSDPITYAEAVEVSAFQLARRWGDSSRWGLAGERGPENALSELACLSALGYWLQAWQPLSIHRSLLAGASVQAVADACGLPVDVIRRRWQIWADGQARLYVDVQGDRRPGISQQEYEHVQAILAGES